jgi:hypothetical protein
MAARMRASGESVVRRGPVGRVTFDAVAFFSCLKGRFFGLNFYAAAPLRNDSTASSSLL